MKGRFEFSLVVLFFILAGLGLVLYKHLALGIPLVREEATTIWNIEARIEFDAKGGPAQVELSLPDNQSGVRILDQSFASPSYGINQFEDNGQPKAQWSIRDTQGRQNLFYKVKLHLQPDNIVSTPADQSPESTQHTLLPEPYLTAATGLLKQTHQRSADDRSFASTLINAFISPAPEQNIVMLLGMPEYAQNKIGLLTQLLAMENISARIVRGLYLEDKRRRRPIVEMLEVYTQQGWVLFNPETGEQGVPDNFFLWQRGGKSLLDVMGGQRSQISFSISLRKPFPAEI